MGTVKYNIASNSDSLQMLLELYKLWSVWMLVDVAPIFIMSGSATSKSDWMFDTCLLQLENGGQSVMLTRSRVPGLQCKVMVVPICSSFSV